MRKPTPSLSMTRRRFIYTSALATGATIVTGPTFAAAPRKLSANDKLNIAAVGCGGKGSSDIRCCSGENIVALCDVSENAAAQQRSNFPKAKFYKDFREMLEKEKTIDAVDVATPDHMHAPIAAMAIKMGKHVYCQKPLTHSVFEARTLRQLAKQHGVATQMGNQGSASDGLRRAVEVVHGGLIGNVRQAYVWTNRPIWPQGLDRPPGSDPVPAGLDWDLWLGLAPARPYKGSWPDEQAASGRRGRGSNVYQPFSWRGWQDFGTGALGDMACHTVNWAFRALKLGYPTEIEAESSGMNKEMYPKNSKIRFEFPAREGLPPLSFWWFDGGNFPPKEVTHDVEAMLDKVSSSGCLLIGDKGQLFSPEDGDQDFRFFVKLKDEKELVRATDHEGAKALPQTEPRNQFKGAPDEKQHAEWIAACKGGTPGYSDFDKAAYLTEIILLGCVALRAGKKLEWEGPNMKAKNAPEAAQFVKREYRKGWTL
jgi:predicted dehydrogenase